MWSSCPVQWNSQEMCVKHFVETHHHDREYICTHAVACCKFMISMEHADRGQSAHQSLWAMQSCFSACSRFFEQSLCPLTGRSTCLSWTRMRWWPSGQPGLRKSAEPPQATNVSACASDTMFKGCCYLCGPSGLRSPTLHGCMDDEYRRDCFMQLICMSAISQWLWRGRLGQNRWRQAPSVRGAGSRYATSPSPLSHPLGHKSLLVHVWCRLLWGTEPHHGETRWRVSASSSLHACLH